MPAVYEETDFIPFLLAKIFHFECIEIFVSNTAPAAVAFRYRKRFFCPEAVCRYCEWAKTLKRAKKQTQYPVTPKTKVIIRVLSREL